MPARPRWNTAVLCTPQVLDVPDVLPAAIDPLVSLALAAMYAQATGDPGASNLAGRLAHAGVVAARIRATRLARRSTSRAIL
jgi:hypothetical protein